MAKKTTLRDVAQAAGVSINTASRALNNKPDVRRETREKVLAKADELHYTPNTLAQALKGKHIRSIGVIVDDLSNPFFAEVLKGAEEVASTHGYTVTVGNSASDPDKEFGLVQTMIEQRTAGLLITPTQRSADFLTLLQADSIPHVLVARRFDSLLATAVLNDDYAGAYQAVEHLLQRGYRRILFLNGPVYLWSAEQRLQGYRRALEAAGLDFRSARVCSCAPTLQASCEAMKGWLNEAADAVDAVFTFNDYMALGAIKAIREHGLRIPEDIGIMGYDGIDVGEMVSPALSTIRIAKRRLGREAARTLIDLIAGERAVDRQTVLPPQLIVRQSTPSRR